MRIRCKIPDNFELLAHMFQKKKNEKRSHNGYASHLLQRRFGADIVNPSARLYSQKYGDEGWWAHLLMEACPELSTLVVTPSLEQLGFDADWVHDHMWSIGAFSKIIDRALGLGLQLCPLSIVPTLILSDLVLPARESLMLVTDPIDMATNRMKPDTYHHRFCISNNNPERFTISATHADTNHDQYLDGPDLCGYGEGLWNHEDQWKRVAKHTRLMFQFPDPHPEMATEKNSTLEGVPIMTEVGTDELRRIANSVPTVWTQVVGNVEQRSLLPA